MAASRQDLLSDFVALLKAEGRRGVLGLNCASGSDGLLFVQSGIHFTGVDPSEENVRSARARGLDVAVAAPASLPFAASAFPSVWAADALAGLPPEQWAGVVRELERVTAAGAPIAVVLPDPGQGFTILRSPA
ncbi:trans-aconitate methyltransferase [Arthrobacter sp. V4I6]|uniref:class I SAM-dependent methyltransferase n=1 Tax=unclassified Arthrobacter TaxID=235627 RepID=UPI002780D39A|nr:MULTISPECIES: class I SAM-dependent methyltransferase [unclassified Arthrobacter]MDQ0822216.1 trans-aconitate methyltransferase [Arthrobacter sp. V1I7]MDQ0856485.1 trans-aconitate methyltransferase [Arthrobacter sp. V4I6]